MDRQGSILSTLSDYDLLDTTQGDFVDDDEEEESIKNKSNNGGRENLLRKNREIFVKVSVRESHGLTGTGVLSSMRLYDVQCFHSGYQWHLVRNYGNFEELHRALRFYRASLVVHKKKKIAEGDGMTEAASNDPTTECASSMDSRQRLSKTKSKALKFPNKPDIFVFSAAQIQKRRRLLEEYLNDVLKDGRYRTHDATIKFMELSTLSFLKHSGAKFHEGFIKKRSGGRRFATILSCFAPSAALWNKRWLVLKDSYVCYMRANQQIADVMLFDQDFDEVRAGLAQTQIHHGLIITNTTRELALKTNSHHKTRNWVNAIEPVAEGCEYVHSTPHQSFAPERKELAHWYVDAVHYFEDVASALLSAREEIFITDWWLTPELFLKRPVMHMSDPSRLDKILHTKAQQGVKVYILLYKEIEMAVAGIQSMKCKSHLESLHPNIKVMRHPDHIKSSIYLWTHHEKIVCVDQTFAFLGGLDLCFGRWDNGEHRLTDLGSVQTVTPPTSRTGSRAGSTAGNAEDWKGFGVEDLNRQRKQESSAIGSKTPLTHSLTTPAVSSQATFTIGDNLQPLSRAVNRRPHSTSDILNLRRYQAEQRRVKCNSIAMDCPSVSGPRSQLDKSMMEKSRSMQALSGTRRTSAVSDHDVFVSVQQCRGGLVQGVEGTGDMQGVDGAGDTQEVDGAGDLRPELLRVTSAGTRSEHDSINSESLTVPFQGGDATDTPSTGFGDKASCDRLHSIEKWQSVSSHPESEARVAISTPEQGEVEQVVPKQDEVRSAASSPEEDRETVPQLLLEPIQGFSYEVATQKKKSRGKIPNPPPKNVYWEMVASALRSEATQKKRTESEAEPPVAARERSSWKKIRSNMDKVKRVWRHEESLRNSSAPVNACSSRHGSISSSCGADASKYWMGKDYVNWILKDLTSVKAPFHDSVDRFSTVRMPWHDVACALFNKAATDVGRHFIQRWNYAKKVKASSKSSNKYPLLLPRSTNSPYKRLPPFIRERCELVNCQIVRSCSGWSSGMQKPENSIYNAYIDLIDNSQHYIYIENQFFISWCGTEVENCICEALINRILRAHKANETFRVYLVLPLLPAFEADLDPHKSGGSPLFSVLHYVQQSLIGNDNSLFKKLYSHGLDPNRYLSVCGLRNHGMLNQVPVTELIYVHSKLMIVDDRKCIIGSANINDRSLAGDRDSEIAVVIQDEFFRDSKMSGKNYMAGKFCFSLRNHLFQEHLGLKSHEFIQDVTCEDFYKKTWITTAVVNTNIYDKVFNCLPCDSVFTFEKLRLYRQQTPLATSEPASAKLQLSKVKGHLVMYPLQFLKNEVLRNYAGAKENLVPTKFWT